MIENFPVRLVGSLDPQSIESERRAIADSMKVFKSRVSNVTVDLDGDDNEVDANRLANLEQMRKKVSDEVLNN